MVAQAAGAPASNRPAPLRGLLALGAATKAGLVRQTVAALERARQGWAPAPALPEPAECGAAERLVIDFGNPQELTERLEKARKALDPDTPPVWKALQPQGIFRGSGPPAGKVAFLFPGQGSQYLNMGRELRECSPQVAAVLAEADAVMAPILGRPLTSFLFVEAQDPAAVAAAEQALTQTAVTQPAMLALDIALLRLLQGYGFEPDMVMGHALRRRARGRRRPRRRNDSGERRG
jgi:acyl transferase domain-containing protein